MSIRSLKESPDHVYYRGGVFDLGAGYNESYPFMKLGEHGSYILGDNGSYHSDFINDIGANGPFYNLGRVWNVRLDNIKFNDQEVYNIVSFWIDDNDEGEIVDLYSEPVHFISSDKDEFSQEVRQLIKNLNLNPHTTLVEIGGGNDEFRFASEIIDKKVEIHSNIADIQDHLNPGGRTGPKFGAGSMAQSKKALDAGFDNFAQYYNMIRQESTITEDPDKMVIGGRYEWGWYTRYAYPFVWFKGELTFGRRKESHGQMYRRIISKDDYKKIIKDSSGKSEAELIQYPGRYFDMSSMTLYDQDKKGNKRHSKYGISFWVDEDGEFGMISNIKEVKFATEEIIKHLSIPPQNTIVDIENALFFADEILSS